MSGYSRQCTDLNLRENLKIKKVKLVHVCRLRYEQYPNMIQSVKKTVSPGWILLNRESPFHVDDIPLVLKHSITQCNLNGIE